jgi:membrane dipeptidase
MSINRRKFVKLSTAMAATSTSVLAACSSTADRAKTQAKQSGSTRPVVIDALGSIGNPNIRFEGLLSKHAKSGRWPELDKRAIQDAHQSGLSAINTTLGYVFGEGKDNPFEYTVREIASYDAMVRAYSGDFLKVLTGKDILRANESGKIGVIYGFQNTDMLGNDASRVQVFSDLGVRVIQLTYNVRNAVGDGSMVKENSGITAFGRDVISQLNDNRLLVDLSHSGEKLCLDAIEASTAPIAITHTGCRGVNDHPRNKTDHELKQLANKGGVAGIYFMPYLKTGSQPYADDVVRHIEHAVNVCGEEHVGIGSDGGISKIDNLENYKILLKADVEKRKKTGVAAPGETVDIVPFTPDMNGPEQYRILAQKLEKRGYSSARLEKILGGNFLRLMTDVWPT